jgi:V-type H+-transporting ATPase subunit E
LEKQTLVHEAKLNVQEEFTKKEKDREIQERIARSSELGECRVRKMRVRDELLGTLVTESGNKCGLVARGQNYPHLVQKLIVQALIKIEETEATVYCRAEDVDIVSQILPDAVTEYIEIIERETECKLSCNVVLNSDRTMDLPAATFGGIKITALNGKIVCDNTMSARLKLVYTELLPSIRAILFPEDH